MEKGSPAETAYSYSLTLQIRSGLIPQRRRQPLLPSSASGCYATGIWE